mmetsp:Transcript_21922/g.21116  ORF Transcript_21922/g.21116 Transcript_21922/m.21116 type:complete len:161 (+) Transcript_21922:1321-1803(+)
MKEGYFKGKAITGLIQTDPYKYLACIQNGVELAGTIDRKTQTQKMIRHPLGKYNISYQVALVRGMEQLACLRTHQQVFIIDLRTSQAFFFGDNHQFKADLPDVKVAGCAYNDRTLEIFAINFQDQDEGDQQVERDSVSENRLVKYEMLLKTGCITSWCFF